MLVYVYSSILQFQLIARSLANTITSFQFPSLHPASPSCALPSFTRYFGRSCAAHTNTTRRTRFGVRSAPTRRAAALVGHHSSFDTAFSAAAARLTRTPHAHHRAASESDARRLLPQLEEEAEERPVHGDDDEERAKTNAPQNCALLLVALAVRQPPLEAVQH